MNHHHHPHSPQTMRRAASGGAALALALALAACGGDSGNNNNAGAGVPPGQDSFVAAVNALIVSGTSDSTEPREIDTLTATSPEDSEPSALDG